MLAAGLDGIRRDLPLPPANEENVYSSTAALDLRRRSPLGVLPASLNQALEALEAMRLCARRWVPTFSTGLSIPSGWNGKITAWRFPPGSLKNTWAYINLQISD